ncbi:DUF2933 domain-containing protein [Paraburkholderia graminis]|uniref:DUF2933 domain-containing protein n=1 Tax=Paraburkholderia graminis TaxID=60548 RepID=A0ABD5CRE4_9BURK|nr:DUF2933 domain-containing protein [Paraburkholderia graminis]MDR6207904.1 hypothetical protein [Paraburkholderia graminis]
MKTPALETQPFWKSRGAIALVGFAAVATSFMFSEHRAHFLGVLPYLIFLACPLMHLFMHHGHHHGTQVEAQHSDPQGGHDERPS